MLCECVAPCRERSSHYIATKMLQYVTPKYEAAGWLVILLITYTCFTTKEDNNIHVA